jgi:ADP-heptose:LPS heptosyltransferase
MKRKFSLYRSLSQLLRLPLAGPVFKLYAPRRRWNDEHAIPGPLRILIANLMPSLGDTICYLPVAELLAEALPGVEITWLADSAMAGLVAKHPNVHRVIAVKTPNSFLNRTPTIKMYFRLYHVMKTMRATHLDHRFDIALIPRGGTDPSLSAQAVWMLNPKRSFGYSHRVEPDQIDHNFGDQLITDLVTRVTVLHESSRALHLLEVSALVPDATQRGTPDSPIRGVRAIADTVEAQALFHKAGVPANIPFIAIAHSAGHPRKIWPAANFRALAQRILADTPYNIVLTGAPAEANVAASVAEGLGGRVFNCAGKITLIEVVALLGKATAFVGNDSGAGHVAGSLGVPVVSLHVQPEGSDPNQINAPEHYRPAGPRVVIVWPGHFLPPCQGRCESSTAHCIGQITVDQVWDALQQSLAGTR